MKDKASDIYNSNLRRRVIEKWLFKLEVNLDRKNKIDLAQKFQNEVLMSKGEYLFLEKFILNSSSRIILFSMLWNLDEKHSTARKFNKSRACCRIRKTINFTEVNFRCKKES